MLIYVDSRERWTQPGSKDHHIPDYFSRHGIEWEVKALNVGDYQLDGDSSVVVDRKKSIDEMATNLLNKSDSARFWREIRRAHSQGIKLIVLCEGGGTKYKTVNDLAAWKSKYSGVTGRRLISEIVRCEYAYGVTFLLCNRRETAKRIVELLTGDGGQHNAETKTTNCKSGGDAE